MNKKDKFYTSKDLTGYDDLDDRLYSEKEVEIMSELFSEFYELHSDYYGDNAENAYVDFYDAYSTAYSSDIEDITPKTLSAPISGNKNVGRYLATGTGATLGLGIAHLSNKKDKLKKVILIKKVNSGLANKSDLKELSSINKRIKLRLLGGTLAGAGTGFGLTVAASNIKRNYDSRK